MPALDQERRRFGFEPMNGKQIPGKGGGGGGGGGAMVVASQARDQVPRTREQLEIEHEAAAMTCVQVENFLPSRGPQ
jgi:hypothetical protein